MPDPMEPSQHRNSTSNEPLRTPLRPVKTYRGYHEADGACVVLVIEGLLALSTDLTAGSVRELPLALDVRAHSPTGFNWSYGGSGPAQLALALLVDALGDRELAQQFYQAFKWAYVAKWESTWSITADEIRAFVDQERTANPMTRDDEAADEMPSVAVPGPARFPLGEVHITPKVAVQIPPDEVTVALARHERGDWGDLEEIDRAQNERYLHQGGVLLSGFRASNGVMFWILTEPDRTRTTVLLTEEY